MSSYSIIGSGAIGSALAGHFASKGIDQHPWETWCESWAPR
jgi:predicted dinucleotide-binding enzyme